MNNINETFDTNVNETVNTMENLTNVTELPAEINMWTKIKNFLFQEIVIELTPKQEKVFQEVHDFWHQEITGKKIHDFLFQEITFK